MESIEYPVVDSKDELIVIIKLLLESHPIEFLSLY